MLLPAITVLIILQLFKETTLIARRDYTGVVDRIALRPTDESLVKY